MSLKTKIAFLSFALEALTLRKFLFNLCRWVLMPKIKLLPLAWLDEFRGGDSEMLRRRATAISCGPNFFFGEQKQSVVDLPDMGWRLFKNARISALSSSVVIDDKVVVVERCSLPSQVVCNYSTGHIAVHNSTSALVRLGKYCHLDKGVFLGGNGASNYYHWIVEILSKLEFVEKIRERYAGYPLLVSEDVLSIPSFADSLKIFAGELELVYLNKKSSYVVKDLVYINSPNNLPFNLYSESRFECSFVGIDRQSIEYIRKKILESTLESDTNTNYSSKIFLCRKAVRRNYNQEEVFDFLEHRGFQKVFFEELTFEEQVRTIHDADFIVGPTGAAWTNLIFCKKGAKGLCWMAEEFGDFAAYSTIAQVVGVDLRYLTYKAGALSTGDLYTRDYTIDLNQIAQALRPFE